MLLQLIAGLVASLAIGLIGYWRGSLTLDGVVGAVMTGTAIVGFGGIVPGILLVAFFASSTALSFYRGQDKASVSDKFEKGSRRDLGQALANGGWAAILSICYGLIHEELFFVGLVGSLAAVTADTWATEVGILSTSTPRLVTSGRLVPRGTSGGVTLLGTLAALCGALLIPAMAVGLAELAHRLTFLKLGVWLAGSQVDAGTLIVAGTVGGFSGSLFDSLLGATVQAIYYCDYDQKETERKVHSCGRATRRLRGIGWLDNDVVNFLASAFGSGSAALIWSALTR